MTRVSKDRAFSITVFYKYRQYVQLSIGIDKTINHGSFKKI